MKDARDLVPGRWYKVNMMDCCIQGEFTSKLDVIWKDSDGDTDILKFQNGVILTKIMQCTFEETT